MRVFTYVVTDESGIHARPAGLLVKRMKEFACTVTMAKGERAGNGKNLFEVMRLGIKCHDTLTVTAEGSDEDEAIAAARDILEAIL